MIRIKTERCKECSFCLNACPDKALEYSGEFNQMGCHPVRWKGSCRLCGVCYIMCPDNAIEITDEETLER